MTTFELIEHEKGNWVRMIRDGQEYAVPCEPANSDYQTYLAWLENPEAALSTPIVAEE